MLAGRAGFASAGLAAVRERVWRMSGRLPVGRLMRVLALAPLLLAAVLAGGGQAAAAVAATCPNGVGGQPPGPSGLGNLFTSVTVVSACDVWAVGSQQTGSTSQATLIEHWTGGPSWATVASPSPGGGSVLTSVRAVSATDIWAVGWSQTRTGKELTLIVHWDGSAWTQKESPNPGSDSSELTGVTATSGASAWAAGSFHDAAGRQRTLIVRWDGSVWTQVNSPSPGLFDRLSAVSATSATNAWAVGTTDGTADGTGKQTLIERWDGSAWTRVNSPAPESQSGLFAVTATAANNAWAVGSSQDSSGTEHALIERWNGSSWAQAASPTGSGPAFLSGVAATSAGNAWAVGDPAAGTGTLVLHWDGSAWTPVASPAPPSGELDAVATTPGGFVWAVGTWLPSGGPDEPLAVRLQGVTLIQAVVQGPDGHVYMTGPVEGLASTGVNVAAGTSPAAAARDRAGQVEAVWQAAGTHHLWTLDPSGHQADTGLAVAAGTSPAIAALPGGFEIAFVNAADGQVWLLGPGAAAARSADPGLVVAAGTSPAIASNSAGGVKVAVHAAGADHLWLIGTGPGGTAHEIGVSLAAGTSPAIAAGPTGFSAAFVNAADGTLWRVRRDGAVNQAPGAVAVAAGTSPAIAAADSGPAFEFAVRAAASGHLVLISDSGAVRDTGVAVLAGTGPAIAAAAGGFEADVQVPSRDLVSVLGSGPGRNTSVIMAAGSSPAAAATFPDFSIVPTVISIDQDIAEGWITDAGLTVGSIGFDSTCKDIKGAVLTQNPGPGAAVAPGTPVNLTVSTGDDAQHNPCIFK